MAFVYEPKPKWTGRAYLLTILFSIGMLIGAGVLWWCIISPARGADLELLKQKHGAVEHRGLRDSDQLGAFGTYSLRYYQRRWSRMCEGPQRYLAMSEAQDRGQPQPCR